MHSFTNIITPLIALVAFAGAACAAPDDAPFCRNGIFVDEGVEYGLARVTGRGRADLVDDNAPCPSAAAACQTKSYLLPGNVVVTARTFGAFRCVLYRDRRNIAGTAGYLPQYRLEPLPARTVSLKDWSGKWRYADDYITIKATRDGLEAEGEAFWPSANPAPMNARGGIHTGSMGGVATPSGNHAAFIDDHKICEVKLTLLPPFLLARDNGSCGGANVYFRGVYMRAR